MNHQELAPEEREQLLGILNDRFEKYMNRHKGLEWARIQARLEMYPEKLRILHEMERTGGEPDVIGFDKETGEYLFCDCSPEVPKGAEAFVTIAKREKQEENTNQRTALSRWQLQWELNF